MKAIIKFDRIFSLMDFLAKHGKKAQFCRVKNGVVKVEFFQYDEGYGIKTKPLNDIPKEEAKTLFLQMIDAAKKEKGFVSIETTK